MPASWNASSKSARRAFVRARTAISSRAMPSSASRLTSPASHASSSSGARERPDDRRRPRSLGRAQHLLGPAEPRHEQVRELEHLRARAVVLLEPHHCGVRVARGDAEQPAGRGSREAVDRLVVVADDAEVVAVAEPELEERLLKQVHVLVLVDGERAVAVAEDSPHLGVALVEPDRELEQVLEVDLAPRLLPALVLLVDPRHQVLRDGRLVVAETSPVLARRRSAGSSPTRSRSRGPRQAGT